MNANHNRVFGVHREALPKAFRLDVDSPTATGYR